MNIHLGPLRPVHAGELLTVQKAAYVSEARRYAMWELPPLIETLDEINRHIESGMPAIGAWDGHRLVGSVRGNVAGERMEVARLSVAPDMGGRGIGRRLLREITEAAPADVRVVWLFTGGESAGSLGLYESEGFVRVDERQDDFGIRVTLEKTVIRRSAARHETLAGF
ncbi:acetyltransferase (GNAT) family protein [Lentzea atacamensis]|uniref:Acetyltransferase (GNAT) family protein n=1 Tax=Lentzea atacamensis TaxID=531938 RepID=A0A316I1B5_9PSEU|nr:acetyltransferase (GNAT) family protein [Lentzea atacamensis]